MSKSKARRTRKHRRALKAVMKHGRKAKRSHKRVSGRTGSVFSKRLGSRNEEGTLSEPSQYCGYATERAARCPPAAP
jgi:hypothetical protein